MAKNQFEHEKRKCKNCGEEFIATRGWSRFCSSACRLKYWRRGHPYLPPEELKRIKEKLGIQE